MNADWQEAEVKLPDGRVVVLNVKVLNDVLYTDVSLIDIGVSQQTVSKSETYIRKEAK